MIILTGILITLYYIGIALVCLRVIIDTQSTTKALAYLFLVIIFPVAGAVIYFSFGVNYRKQKLYQRKLSSDLTQFHDVEKKIFNFSRQILEQNEETLAHFYPLACMVNREGKSLTTTNNEIALSYYESLLQVGIEIYKYQKGFVHAKTMVCDGLVSFVGTANLDQRSFDLNFEVNAIVYDNNFSKQLRTNFLKDIEEAEKIKLEDWVKRPYYTILIEKIIRLFSPLL